MSCAVSKLFRAARVTAVASKFHGSGGIVAVLATVLGALGDGTVTSGMRAFVFVCHKLEPPIRLYYFNLV